MAPPQWCENNTDRFSAVQIVSISSSEHRTLALPVVLAKRFFASNRVGVVRFLSTLCDATFDAKTMHPMP